MRFRCLLRPRALVAILLIQQLLGPAPVQAQAPAAARPEAVEQSRRIEENAKRLHREGKLKEALAEYERARRIYERTGLLFNMAQAHRRIGYILEGRERREHFRQAVELYRRYLSRAPEERERDKIEQRVRAMEQELQKPVLPDPARTTPPPVVQPPPPPPAPVTQDVPSRPWYKRWYVWTAIGVVLVGGAAAGGVLATRSSGIPATDYGDMPVRGLAP